MFPIPFFEITSLLTETALQLSPVFIKRIDADVNTIILIQVIVKLVIALCLVDRKEIDKMTDLTPQNFTYYLLIGILSFLSVNIVYNSFKELPTPVTLLIRSFAPVFLVCILIMIGFTQPLFYIPIFLIAFVVLLYTLRPKPHHYTKFKKMDKEKRDRKYKSALGLICISLIGASRYVLKKFKEETYESNIIRTNLFALFFSMAYFIYNDKIPEIKLDTSIYIILHTIVIGYFLTKFHSKSYESGPEIYYAIFIFTGIIISYFISEKFLKHKEPEDFKED